MSDEATRLCFHSSVSIFSCLNSFHDFAFFSEYFVFKISTWFPITLVLICHLLRKSHRCRSSRVSTLVSLVSSFAHYIKPVPLQTLLTFPTGASAAPSACLFDPALLRSPDRHGWLSCRSDWTGRRSVLATVPPHP